MGQASDRSLSAQLVCREILVGIVSFKSGLQTRESREFSKRGTGQTTLLFGSGFCLRFLQGFDVLRVRVFSDASYLALAICLISRSGQGNDESHVRKGKQVTGYCHSGTTGPGLLSYRVSLRWSVGVNRNQPGLHGNSADNRSLQQSLKGTKFTVRRRRRSQQRCDIIWTVRVFRCGLCPQRRKTAKGENPLAWQ